jgi:hypothetical protein
MISCLGMKIFVFGSNVSGVVIHGYVFPGYSVVIRHKGKVKKAIVIRSKAYNSFGVSYDVPAVVISGDNVRIKGPISKGINVELKAVSRLVF